MAVSVVVMVPVRPAAHLLLVLSVNIAGASPPVRILSRSISSLNVLLLANHLHRILSISWGLMMLLMPARMLLLIVLSLLASQQIWILAVLAQATMQVLLSIAVTAVLHQTKQRVLIQWMAHLVLGLVAKVSCLILLQFWHQQLGIKLSSMLMLDMSWRVMVVDYSLVLL